MSRKANISSEGARQLVENSGEALSGDAAGRLARFEDFYEHLIWQRQSIPVELDRLRAEGKTKSRQFKELLGQKLMAETTLSLLARFGIE
ncbi:MAG: hypothetical protein LBM75_08455 [Myxococcales bacterium]|jgi:hypothetical protein|nr:hypothetical protein [Myxococcales bacterium]